ncbi:MAG: adenosyl-hopene transferase HpnH [Thermoguttaceae bacterium]|jgi:hopanoid biosynthesis associated radical SAM protein HpnH|nr:adenosyl-hopene transferase HpnH [Thermoguttaceae bacterium]
MRFPLSLTRSLTGYLVRNRLAGRRRFPLVLMLEPLHACNLACAGCGRVREYADSIHQTLSLEECVAATDECKAPVVSICGGEPLIYPEIGELVRRLVERNKHVYVCTNGLLLAKRLDRFCPSSRVCFNVHLDGMEASHDAMAGRPGVFAQATAGIRAAKNAGFRVCTNTTIYRQTDLHEIVVLFEYLSLLGVDGFLLSPAYAYEAVGPQAGQTLFMTRDEIHEKFRHVRALLDRFQLMSSPIYLDFLCGQRELPCAAWANPTRNIRGWKGPCYLITDTHYASYRELLEATDWDRLGPAGDPRCRHCLVHCGFEPAAVFAAQRRWRDAVRMAVWQMR